MTSIIKASTPKIAKLLLIRNALQLVGGVLMLGSVAAAVLTNTGTVALDANLVLVVIGAAILILLSSIVLSIFVDRAVKANAIANPVVAQAAPAITEPQGE